MRNSLLATAVIATAILGGSAASQAEEQNAPAPQAAGQATPPAGADLGPDRAPPPHIGRMPRPEVLGLATKLSAAEIYLGVTPEQLGPWRAYATALIDLVSPGADRNPPPPQGAEPRLAGEELAGIMVKKAEQAKALQDAVAALKPKLSPQQVLKLAELERALMPPPPPPHHGSGQDGRFGPPQGGRTPPVPQAERG